jgi:hypothetical protein
MVRASGAASGTGPPVARENAANPVSKQGRYPTVTVGTSIRANVVVSLLAERAITG